MSDGAPLRAVAFGTADGSLWAAAIDLGRPAMVVGAGDAGAGSGDGLSWSDGPDGSWRLEGDGVSLSVTAAPAPEPGQSEEPVDSAAEPDEDEAPAPVLPPPGPGDPSLCRVTGTVTAGEEIAVDCTGVRMLMAPPSSAKAAPASARIVAGWLEDGGSVGLVAVRPRNASHQDGDRVAAALFDPERWIAVADPRLSTTYDGSGAPTRANLELWVGDGDNEFPRRVAGEASGPTGSVSADGLALRAAPLACHSRGREGAGVYALVTF
jgi:hypothetical protein